MKRVNGPITARLMSIFGGGSAAWWPPRPADLAGTVPVPRDVGGHRIGAGLGRRAGMLALVLVLAMLMLGACPDGGDWERVAPAGTSVRP